MKLPNWVWVLARLAVLTGCFFYFGKYIRTSGPYIGHSTRLLPGFTESLVVGGLERPSTVSIAPDGRVFVVFQDGTVRIIENGVLLPEPFVSIPVYDHFAEGMFHLAFDPDFTTNGFVYLYFATHEPRRNRLLRVTAQGNRALPDSFYTVWESPPLTQGLDHDGGSPIFDENGFIYFGTGDTTSAVLPRMGQSPANLPGKILRLTRDGAPAPDNPFSNVPGALPQVFALGFRNPYNLARDPVSGIILVNDIGQDDVEEINRLVPGGNFGWGTCEGSCDPPDPARQDPLVSYGHGLGADTGCAVASGTFYRPAQVQFPRQYVGNYLYADLCSGWIRALDLDTLRSTVLATGILSIEDLDVAPDGSLYYLKRGVTFNFYASAERGQLWRITYQPP